MLQIFPAENKVFSQSMFLKMVKKLFSKSFLTGGAGQSPCLHMRFYYGI